MTEAERIEKTPPHETLKCLLETIERETIPMQGHQDPNALKDCWLFAYDLIEEMLNECSHLAANTCPHSYGDEFGNQRCSEIDKKDKHGKSLQKQLEYASAEYNKKSQHIKNLEGQLKQKDELILKLSKDLADALEVIDGDLSD